jgi:hypothetical protein
MAQRNKKLAWNRKSALPEKPIVPALPQHIMSFSYYPPSYLRPPVHERPFLPLVAPFLKKQASLFKHKEMTNGAP